jgi:hypothetical protein
VTLELRFLQLSSVLEKGKLSFAELSAAIDTALLHKNEACGKSGKPPLRSYCRDYALLQEVTKGAAKQMCGSLTVAHTVPLESISPRSVTSFYEVGLAIGLVDPCDQIAYKEASTSTTTKAGDKAEGRGQAESSDDGATALVDAALDLDISGADELHGVGSGHDAATSASSCSAVSFVIRLDEEALQAAGAAREAALRVAEGHAHWLLAFWAGGQQRKHPGLQVSIESCTSLRVEAPDNGSGVEAELRRAAKTALKKVDVEDLGPMDAAQLWDCIPEEDGNGRGRQDLRKVEKELSVKVVFCAPPGTHVLLVGAKPKLAKKCFVLRNLLSHYHWRLSGRDVAFDAMTATS